MTIKGAVNFVGVCSMVCDAVRMAIIPFLTSLKLVRKSSHSYADNNAHERTHTRTRARTHKHTIFDKESGSLKGRADRCHVPRSCLQCFCVASQGAVSDSNFFSRTAQFSAGRNVRNQLKVVVWNCEMVIDAL